MAGTECKIVGRLTLIRACVTVTTGGVLVLVTCVVVVSETVDVAALLVEVDVTKSLETLSVAVEVG